MRLSLAVRLSAAVSGGLPSADKKSAHGVGMASVRGYAEIKFSVRVLDKERDDDERCTIHKWGGVLIDVFFPVAETLFMERSVEEQCGRVNAGGKRGVCIFAVFCFKRFAAQQFLDNEVGLRFFCVVQLFVIGAERLA